ncbi:Benzoate 4-monooxygenase cytochrome P450 protein [Rutstroemia sp. NJR-2017a WRK4]|nr:Benzoate 4-monooxygenase cytochrome P450 protein [Rutstroemia sp. NJR-2017a WRK4]
MSTHIITADDIYIATDTILQHWFLAGFIVALTYYLTSAIYSLYFSPLAHYPGPFLAKISAWPNFYYSCIGYRHLWIWRCHEIYGPSFRYKPNGVLFNTSTAYHAIHSTRAPTKRAQFYAIWTRDSEDINTLETIDKEAHARKRKVLNQAFSERSLKEAESFVVEHVGRWVQRLREQVSEDGTGKVVEEKVEERGGWSKPINMSEWSDWLVFDIMGELSFGRSFGLKEKGPNQFREIPHTISDYVKFMYPITTSPMLTAWLWLKPRGLDALFKLLLPSSIRSYYEFIDSSVALRIEEEQALLKNTSDSDSVPTPTSRKDIFHYLYASTPRPSLPELHSESNLLIIAGTDTTSTTLVGLWFYILRSPSVYAKLVNEIRTAFSSEEEIRSGPKLASCTYLYACIQESLRCAPALTSELPRIVIGKEGLHVDGGWVPEGTQVGVGGWAIMHNEVYFPDAWRFKPERWILEEGMEGNEEKRRKKEEDIKLAKAAFNPFTIGVGNCVGQKLAWQEMLVTVGRTLWALDLRLVEGDLTGAGGRGKGLGVVGEETILLRDAYVSLREGPMVEVRERKGV